LVLILARMTRYERVKRKTDRQHETCSAPISIALMSRYPEFTRWAAMDVFQSPHDGWKRDAFLNNRLFARSILMKYRRVRDAGSNSGFVET